MSQNRQVYSIASLLCPHPVWVEGAVRPPNAPEPTAFPPETPHQLPRSPTSTTWWQTPFLLTLLLPPPHVFRNTTRKPEFADLSIPPLRECHLNTRPPRHCFPEPEFGCKRDRKWTFSTRILPTRGPGQKLPHPGLHQRTYKCTPGNLADSPLSDEHHAQLREDKELTIDIE